MDGQDKAMAFVGGAMTFMILAIAAMIAIYEFREQSMRHELESRKLDMQLGAPAELGTEGIGR
jgi:hypothetical protein